MSKLYTSILLIFTAFALMSNSGGRGSVGGEAVTGAPGEGGRTCGSNGCHSAGQFEPNVSMELISQNSGSLKDSYKAGNLYTTRLTIDASGTPGGYGFQMVALNANGKSSGVWTANDDSQTVTLDGKSYIEHSKRITDSVIELTWTAPEEDEGDVTFYIAANAVNGTGSPAGDGSTTNSITIEYDPTLSTGEEVFEAISVYPNPAIDELNVSNHSSSKYSIFNVHGQQVQNGNLQNNQIDVLDLNPGMYMLELDNNQGISRFIKI